MIGLKFTGRRNINLADLFVEITPESNGVLSERTRALLQGEVGDRQKSRRISKMMTSLDTILAHGSTNKEEASGCSFQARRFGPNSGVYLNLNLARRVQKDL